KQNLGGLGNVKVFQTGWNADLPFGPALKAMLEEPYTLFAAFIGSTMLTMATHGTDQDMVQRMLTAPDHRKSQLSLILSGVMDLPIAGAFLTVGILLSVFYTVVPSPDLPAADNEIFGYYIVHEMPVVFRGLIIAGVFATMMGSTSAALNALATSFTKDFYLPYINRNATDQQAIRAARIATSVFGILMILCKLSLPAFDVGALLRGEFKHADWNFGWFMPDWWPKIAWPWFVCVGCLVTIAISILFRTPESQIATAGAHVRSTSAA